MHRLAPARFLLLVTGLLVASSAAAQRGPVPDPLVKENATVKLAEHTYVIPDDNVAKTDKPVQITDANTLITSVGLEFNNETRILKLLSNVRGRYKKPKPAR